MLGRASGIHINGLVQPDPRRSLPACTADTWLIGTVVRILCWFLTERRARHTVREVSELDDRMLHEIGLERAEIEPVARGDWIGRRPRRFVWPRPGYSGRLPERAAFLELGWERQHFGLVGSAVAISFPGWGCTAVAERSNGRTERRAAFLVLQSD